MTELSQSEMQVLSFVRGWKNSKDGRAMSEAPGVPMSRFQSDELPALRSLLAAGSLKLVEVTKPSKVDPTSDVTYSYVAATKPTPTCRMVTTKGHDCGRPAKNRILGNVPVCGLHARAAEQRGDEIRPL